MKNLLMPALGLMLILSALCLADNFKNYYGWGDTSNIEEFGADSLKYSKAFTLGDVDGIRLMVFCDDTAEAGFASDSINFYFGYQTGCPTLDSSGAKDTLWDVPIILDTIQTDSLGIYNVGTSTVAGVPIITHNLVDTLQITGYAVRSMRFVPYWDVLIRYWAQGVTGNRAAAPIVVYFQHNKRMGLPVRETK